jgi:hypothetical protein
MSCGLTLIITGIAMFKNERLPLQEWIEMKSYYLQFSSIAPLPESITFPVLDKYMGKTVIYCKYSDQVILFEKCEYCHSRKGIDVNSCCVNCGGYVEQ